MSYKFILDLYEKDRKNMSDIEKGFSGENSYAWSTLPVSYTAGRIRSVPVSIGRSTYIPPLPYEPQVKEELSLML